MLIWLLPLSTIILFGLTSWEGSLWPVWLLVSLAVPFLILLFSLGHSPWQKRLQLSTFGLLALHLAGVFGLWIVAETGAWRNFILASSLFILLSWAAEIRAKKESGEALAWLQVGTFVYGVFGLVAGLSAFSALADYNPWWLFLGSVVLASVGLYSLFGIFNIHISRWWLWAAVATFLLLEMAAVILLQPLGAYTQGALVALLAFGLLLNFDIPKNYSVFTRTLVWFFLLALTGGLFFWSVANIF